MTKVDACDIIHYLKKIGGEKSMTSVKVGANETLESALKRFKRKCQKDGVIGDIRRKEAYEKPSIQRKKKQEAAKKRMRRS